MPSVPLQLHPREEVALQVVGRDERGKGPVGRLRREQALLPGIVYGHKQDPQSFKVGQRLLEKALGSGGRNAIFMVEIEGTAPQRALIREVQYHKVSGDIEHVDFLRIDPEEKLRVSVPLVITGTPAGVRVGGGALQQTLTQVDMECVASELPASVEIDVTELEIGDSVHIRDIIEQENRILTDPDRTIANVLVPRLTIDEEQELEGEEIEGVEGEEGEGVEGAEGAEGGGEGGGEGGE